MRLHLIPCWIMALLLALLPSRGIAQRPPSDATGIIAESGGAEVDEIKIVRRKVAKHADILDMTLGLWLPLNGTFSTGDKYLVQLTELNPIKDDAGRLLSTKRPPLFQSWEVGEGEVEAGTTKIMRGQQGPVLTLVLDAPARSASSLKQVKGKATVHLVKTETVSFTDIAATLGKRLEHQTLKELSVVPDIKTKGDETTVTLTVPVRHARLFDWYLKKDGQRLYGRVLGKRQPPGKDFVELTETYDGDVKGCSLHLEIAVPVKSRTFTFEFKDLELP
jgi:hypothetical protein